MSEKKEREITRWDRTLAFFCEHCPACRYARAKGKGGVYEFVRRAESEFCPFCRAYARVHHQKAHEAPENQSEK